MGVCGGREQLSSLAPSCLVAARMRIFSVCCASLSGATLSDWNSDVVDLWPQNAINAGSDLTRGPSEHMCRTRDPPKQALNAPQRCRLHGGAPRQIGSPNPPGTRLPCNTAAWLRLFGSAAYNLLITSDVKCALPFSWTGFAAAVMLEALVYRVPDRRWRKSSNGDPSETAELPQTPPGAETAGNANNRVGERSNVPAVPSPELSKDSGVRRRRGSNVGLGPHLGKLSAQLGGDGGVVSGGVKAAAAAPWACFHVASSRCWQLEGESGEAEYERKKRKQQRPAAGRFHPLYFQTLANTSSAAVSVLMRRTRVPPASEVFVTHLLSR